MKLRINAGERMSWDIEIWRKECVCVLPSTNTTSSNLMHRKLGIGGERHHSYTGHKVYISHATHLHTSQTVDIPDSDLKVMCTKLNHYLAGVHH